MPNILPEFRCNTDLPIVKYRDGNNLHGDKYKDNIPVSFIPNFPGLNINSTNHGPFVTLVTTTDFKYCPLDLRIPTLTDTPLARCCTLTR